MNMTAPPLPSAEQLLADPGASFWMKRALQDALKRDPVDAASDASLMAAVLAARAESLMSAHFDRTMATHLPAILGNLEAAASRRPGE
jgi:hypothetical protein